MAKEADYTISQVEENRWTIAKWEGGETPTTTYEVVESERGSLTCTCPSGVYRGWCKHTVMVRKKQKEVERES